MKIEYVTQLRSIPPIYHILSIINNTYYSIIIKQIPRTNTKPQHYSQPYIHLGELLPQTINLDEMTPFVDNEFNLTFGDLTSALNKLVDKHQTKTVTPDLKCIKQVITIIENYENTI